MASRSSEWGIGDERNEFRELTTDRAYFDWNATAPLRPEARAAVVAALGQHGNASSLHGEGRAARALIEQARREVASLVNAEPKNVIFTSGGSEANALALTPEIEAAGVKARDSLFVSAIEHPSVLAGGRFAKVQRLAVTGAGVIELGKLEQALAGAKAPLVSVMFANNETGVVQPVRAAADIVHAAGGLLHVDAVQGAGRIVCDIAALGADLMTLSSHKIGGPQGAGALVLHGDLHIAAPLIRGGGQERNRRGGTENVAAIAGFGAAAGAARAERASEAERITALRNRVEAELRRISPQAVIVGADAERLPNTTLVLLPGVKAETALIALDLNGIAVSSGSACSSGKVQESHVLAAMGLPAELARSAVRLSIGRDTGERDIELLLNAWKTAVSPLSKGQAAHREIAA